MIPCCDKDIQIWGRRFFAEKLLYEKLCRKIDDLIDLLKLLPIRDKCLTLEELQTFVKKEGGDMTEISEKPEESKQEFHFFAPKP
jgi:hypothetical protein